MEKQLINLKLASKQLQRCVVKCNKDEVTSRNKLKQAIQKGDNEGARIHAENAIRNKNTATSYLKLCARMDAVISRVQTAVLFHGFSKNISSVVNSMEAAARSMDTEKLCQIMDKFESEFDNVEVKSKVMDTALSNTISLSTPENEVQSLMKEVAEEAGIELNQRLDISTPGSTIGTAPISVKDEEDLEKRLARLRQC